MKHTLRLLWYGHISIERPTRGWILKQTLLNVGILLSMLWLVKVLR